ncbi:hypothetical protein F0562_027277 [Nyssa sinensis]|uniref:Uncharacterized protein n=1 Tax=Nyssa sinensis TaxID=561372 RepID=A0A5J5B3F7_9ASTE|nr:hypothetical protein F0562_027277 [Nyssa sinensis]
MSFFFHDDPPNSSSKRCKFLTSTLKDAFSNCHISGGRFSSANAEEEDPASDFDDEQDVVVSEIRSRAMEAKSRRRASLPTDSFCWLFSPTTGELIITPEKMPKKENCDDEGREDFFSVGSCFSRCSSATTVEAFLSVKTNFSRCSSLKGLDSQDFQRRSSWSGFDFHEFQRRSIIQEFRHCEGWPFGLCRKALLLPPLPKSPTESWSWRKGARIVKLP